VAWNARVDVWVDVRTFQAQLAAARRHEHTTSAVCAECAAALATAARLHTDDFLAGFALPESPAFDEWQFFQRESLRHDLAEALAALSHWCGQRGEYGEAIAHARRWLALDPLHEPAQRGLKRLYAQSGKQSAALRQYEEAVRLLDRELLRVLVTSRIALNIQEEWFHPVDGLSFPAAGDDTGGVERLAQFDALRLFDQLARRARSDFSLSREREHVVRLCRLVAGMPLVIELAASWLKVLTVGQIVSEIECDIDMLTARDQTLQERHRSMRAVLEEAWSLLAAADQRTLANLAVFSGGFDSEAAFAVADAALPGLANLVDKAMLRNSGVGDFQCVLKVLCVGRTERNYSTWDKH
jgi:tetratricopeptide (TPR) repeat protein